MREIEDLEAKKDVDIKPEQQKKIEGKPALEAQIKEIEDIRKMYHQAEAEAGKTHKPAEKKPKAVPTLSQQDKHPVIKPTLNLVHLAQIYLNSHNKEEMQKNANTPMDLDTFLTFAQNLFGLNQASLSHPKFNVYLNHCYHELDRYLNASEEVALNGLSYKYILENVEKYINSQYFQGIITQVAPKETKKEVAAEVKKADEEVHKEQASPAKVPVKEPVVQPHAQPESPNQMLTTEEDKKANVKKPVAGAHHEEEYGPEGKFEENVHGHRGGRRGGGRGGHGRGSKEGQKDKEGQKEAPKEGQENKEKKEGEHHRRRHHRKHHEDGEHREHHENHQPQHHEEEKDVDEDGFIIVKHKHKEPSGRGGRGSGRGGGRGRGGRGGGDRNFKSAGGERPHREHHEGEEEQANGEGHEKGAAGKRGGHHRPAGGHRGGARVEYVVKKE